MSKCSEDDQGPPELAGYTGFRLLDRGGFSRVYAARREADGLRVAIKVALRRDDPRFAREAAALRRLGAPLTPTLLEHGMSGMQHPYLVMERVEGGSLARWVPAPSEAARALTERGAIGCDLCRTLEAIHGAGVVHRDLKPSNVMLRDAAGGPCVTLPGVTLPGVTLPGVTLPRVTLPRVTLPGVTLPRVTLIDFGLARLLQVDAGADSPALLAEEPEITREGARLGTLLYMSPEQCLGQQVDTRADIYGLGVVLFELLTGRPPFEGDASAVAQAHVSRRPPRPSQLAPIPEALDAVVLRCLAKRPQDRFQRAGELAEALAEALARAGEGDEPASARAPRSAAAGPPSRSRREVALLAVRSRAPLGSIAEAARREGGIVARVADPCCVIAFPESASPGAGVRAALRVAGRLAGAAEEPIVHVAPLIVRGSLLMGSALDHVASWPAWEGGPQASLTQVAAAALDLLSADSSAQGGPESRTGLAEPPPSSIGHRGPPSGQTLDSGSMEGPRSRAALLGRDALLAAIREEAALCIAERGPALSVLLGEVGHGKTCLLEAALAEVAPLYDVVLTVRALLPEQGDPEAVLRALLTLALDLGERPSAEAVRAACQARLEAAEAAAVWPAVALALRALTEGDAAVAPIVQTPSGLRRAAARAVAGALRARAAARSIALLVDDAQWADPTSLDALELCAHPGAPGALWVCVVASPALLGQRPQWGERAARRSSHELLPLDEGSTHALLRELLRPVEFVPEQVLDQLWQVTGGVPLYVVEVVHALRAGGAIRPRPSTGDWYLASDDLLHGSATPLAERLAARASAGLPPALLDLLRLCCVLGSEIEAGELARIQAELEALAPAAAGDEAALVDAAAGLERLARLGVLRAVGRDRYRFRHPIVRDAHEQLTPPAARRMYHDAARRYLTGHAPSSEAALARLAGHAAGCGEHAQAARAYLDLAASAVRRHRYVEAEQHYTSTLLLLPADDAAGRERALAGRGRVRTDLERHHDALHDLRKARALSGARGDEALVATLLLDEATLLDFCEDRAASAEAALLAAPLVEALGDGALLARLEAARGRTHWRYERTREAIAALTRADQLAAACGDPSTRVESLLMLAPALVSEGLLDEAEQRFADVVTLCEQTGDRLHLGAAYINRIVIWIKRQDHGRAAQDQRRALSIARELGHADMERYATYNLAELLYYRGAYEEAEPLARRARELQLRLHARPTPDDTLLLARIAGAGGRGDEAAALLGWLREQCPDDVERPSVRAILRGVELLIRSPRADEPAAWDALLVETRGCALLDELRDAAYHAAARAVSARRWGEARRRIAEAAAEAADSPLWQGRLAELRARLPDSL